MPAAVAFWPRTVALSVGKRLTVTATSRVSADLAPLAQAAPVELAVCAHAMRAYRIPGADLAPGATVVPAGVVADRAAEGYLQ